jgi:hypothetical protein
MSFHHQSKIITNGLGFYVDFLNPKSINTQTYALTDLGPNKIPITLFYPEQNTLSIVDGYAQFDPSTEDGNATIYGSNSAYFNTIKDNLTLETCVYTDAVFSTPPQYTNRPVSPRYIETGSPCSYALGNGVIGAEINVSPGTWLTTTYAASAVQNQQWVYITLTTLANDSYKTYVNAQFINKIDLTGYTVSVFDGIMIGRGYYGGNRNFQGRVSFVRIYNRPLSPSEIWQNFTAFKNRFGF